MKSIFDSSFRYGPGFKTDVRETFRRVLQEQQADIRREQRAARITHQQQAGGDASHIVSIKLVVSPVPDKAMASPRSSSKAKLMKCSCALLLVMMYGVALATDHHVDPPDKIAKLYNNWIGKHSSVLIDQWGTPKNTWHLPSASGGSHAFLGYTQPVGDCDTIFRVDPDNKIESWRQYGPQCPSRKRFRQGKRE